MSTAKWIDTAMGGVVWTRSCREARLRRPALAQDETADLVIVGGGYCGLTTAIAAAQAGLRVLVLEAGIVGVGASGRNGGYAVPHFPGAVRPSAIEARLGPRKGPALNAMVANGPDRVADLVRRYAIQSDYQQNGWVQPAHSAAAEARVRAVFDDWAAFGAPVEWLDRAAVAAETGAAGYLSGWKNAAGAVVNPYAQALGLARAAEQEGARICEESRVTAIDQQAPGQVIVSVRSGGRSHRVQAGRVLIATNAYTDDLLPELSKSVITLRLYHCATRPLPPTLLDSVLPRRNCFTDLRKSGGFGRLDVQGRLIAGGAVFAAANARSYGLNHARGRVRLLFPQLRDQDIVFDDYWEGYACITEPYIPHVQRLRADVFSLIGFSTRGVSLAQNIGLVMGEFFAGQRGLDDVPLEVIDGVRRIPLQAVKTAVGRNIFPLYRLKDRLGLS